MSEDFHFSPRPNRAAEISWRPWSESSFAEADAADKPILLSISAVWCHWCHVMDETTYSDQRVIDLINRDYLPIRVDNDLRPDINQRYNMGGWPTTAFLTPRGDILTGATYMPADQMAGTLEEVGRFYRTEKPEIIAKVLENRKKAGMIVAASAGTPEPGLVNLVLDSVESAYDATYGGFGNAPKFPQTEALLLLTEQALIRDRPDLMDMARRSLEAMGGGGTYDHVEGGFFRYSTTQDWSVPHFEKMLEDHAGLISALARAGLGDLLDRTTAYLDTVLRASETGLYGGSQDADENYYALDAAGRGSQQAPFVDRRVYTAWNAALAVAYLEADSLLGRPQLKANAQALLEKLFAERYSEPGGLQHAEGIGGQLADQVWGLLAAIRAYSAGLGADWLQLARSLAQHIDTVYGDTELGGYFDHAVSERIGRLEDRVKQLPENSIAAIALFELDALEGDPQAPHRRAGFRALESIAQLPARYGIMAASFARAYDRYLKPAVKVTTGEPALARTALATYPYAVIEPSVEKRVIVCVGTECLAPVTTAGALGEVVAAAAYRAGPRQPV